MVALLLTLILAAQGIPPLPSETGTVTGVLKTATGEPAVGVRVTAMAEPESVKAVASVSASTSLAETDEEGRYRLENVSPGRYLITAGRVDHPTYYPGTMELPKAAVVSVTARATLAGVNFVMDDASYRPPDFAGMMVLFSGATAVLTMPIQVQMEGSSKQPVAVGSKFVVVRLVLKSDGTISELPLKGPTASFGFNSAAPGMEFRVTVENLPDGFAVKSMEQGVTDLLNNTLKLTAANFSPLPGTFSGPMPAGMSVFVLGPGGMQAAGPSGIGIPLTPLKITLSEVPTSLPLITGVRVSGHVPSIGNWGAEISGVPGILFTDGSFEFRGVAPGRHAIVLKDHPTYSTRFLAASIVVGNQNLESIDLDDTRVLPAETRFPASGPAPGSTIPLAWIRGHITDATSKEGVSAGTVTLIGKSKATYQIDDEGRFEIPRLLPGSYDLTIEGFHHEAIQQSVIIGDDDVALNVSSRSID